MSNTVSNARIAFGLRQTSPKLPAASNYAAMVDSAYDAILMARNDAEKDSAIAAYNRLVNR
jgi:hypothetical protein